MYWTDLALLVAVGAAMRVVAIVTIGDVARLHGDEGLYVGLARGLAEGDGFAGSSRAPGYPTMLAIALLVGGDGVLTLRLAQGLVGLTCIALVYDLVGRRWGRGAAVASGLIVAMNPTLTHYAHFLWPETLVSALLIFAVWLADRSVGDRRLRWLVGAGVVLGVGALTKEVLLYLGPLFALWIWWSSSGMSMRARLRRPALFALAMAATILPWTARNYAVQGRFVLISTARWVPIAYGLLIDPGGGRRQRALAKELRDGLREIPDEIAREEFARTMAMRAVATAKPRWVVRKLWDGPRKLFSAETQVGRFVQQRWLAPEWRSAAGRLVAIEVGFFALSVGLGLIGLWMVPDPRLKPLIVAILLFFVGVHTVAFSTSRYRVPLLPLLAMYVGPLLAGRFELRRGAWLRALGACLCVVWLGAAIASTSRRAFALDRGARRAAGQPLNEPFD